jgi:protein ImuB
MDRIVCAFIPRFELAVNARKEPGIWQRPLAVTDLATGSGRLAAVTPAAEARGARVGQPAAQARSLCPELEILAPDPQLLATGREEVLRALSRLAPRLDDDGRGAFFLGLQGMDRLLAPAEGGTAPVEERFGRGVIAALKEVGFEAAVAVADHPFVAWVAALRACPPGSVRGFEMSSGPIAVVPPGGGATFLHHVTLSSLGLSPPAAQLLSLLGVDTAGALLRLPPGALSLRLGPEGRRLERLCRREGPFAHPSSEAIPDEVESASLDLDGPVEDQESLLFIAKSLLDRLVASLRHSGKAIITLTVVARLDDRSQVVHAIAPAEPTLDARALLDLIRLWLGSTPFGAPVTALTLLASRTGSAQARQLGLFRQKEEQEALAMQKAIARLVAAFGNGAVVKAELEETYRPEERVRWVPFIEKDDRERERGLQAREAAGGSRKGGRGAAGGPGAAGEHGMGGATVGAAAKRGARNAEPGRMVLRLLQRPEAVIWIGDWLRRAGRAPVRVLEAEGPHRLAGGWWEGTRSFDRSYFWLSTREEGLLWIFRDEREGGVFLQGWGD